MLYNIIYIVISHVAIQHAYSYSYNNYIIMVVTYSYSISYIPAELQGSGKTFLWHTAKGVTNNRNTTEDNRIIRTEGSAIFYSYIMEVDECMHSFCCNYKYIL